MNLWMYLAMDNGDTYPVNVAGAPDAFCSALAEQICGEVHGATGSRVLQVRKTSRLPDGSQLEEVLAP